MADRLPYPRPHPRPRSRRHPHPNPHLHPHPHPQLQPHPHPQPHHHHLARPRIRMYTPRHRTLCSSASSALSQSISLAAPQGPKMDSSSLPSLAGPAHIIRALSARARPLRPAVCCSVACAAQRLSARTISLTRIVALSGRASVSKPLARTTLSRPVSCCAVQSAALRRS